MTAEPVIPYNRSHRLPVQTAMVAAVALILLAVWTDLPLWVWIIWLSAVAALVWSLRQPSACGMQISDRRLIWHRGRRSGSVAIGSIAYAELSWSHNGSGECRLVLRDGSTVMVPQCCLPSIDVVAGALEADGVTVRRE